MRKEGCHKRGSVSPTNFTGGSFLSLDEAKQMKIHLCIYSSKSCPGSLSLVSRYAGWTEFRQVALVINTCWSNMYLPNFHVA